MTYVLEPDEVMHQWKISQFSCKECRGRMPPPEAYIAEYTPSTFGRSLNGPARRADPVINVTDGLILRGISDIDEDDLSRNKRVFPFSDNSDRNRTGNSSLASTVLRLGMDSVIGSIPNFFTSVARVVQTGSTFEGSSRSGGRSANNMREGRKLGNSIGRNSHGDQLPVVLLKHGGGVEGYYMGTMNGRKISAYEGIPYAEPPIGNRRFKPPEPIKPWKGILQVQKPGSTCLQTHPIYFFRVTGTENCLYANVYSPLIPYRNNDKLFPVLIFIHGGSFIYGTGSEYGPAYLLDQDIILVTFNYRLGALGFLSTGDDVIPGNNGLKDQALLIKWVHENIRNFGGDPDRVTISGQSAGAVAAHLHLIANKITNYFHNGISMSGSAFGFWPVLTKERAMRLTNSLAKRLNCPYRSSVELARCLRNVDGSWIIMTQLHLFSWVPFHPLTLFSPVVEPEGPGAYLTKWAADAYANKEVERKPWIFGQTLNEGHFETNLLKLFMQGPTIALNVKKYLPLILDYDYFTPDQASTDRITDKLIQYYDSDGVTMDSISDMYTDRYYTNTIHKAIHAHSRVAPTKTYAYIFNYTGKYNLGELFGVPREEWGSGHTEDAMMIFNSSSFHHGLSKRDIEYQLSEIMTNVVTNFVTTSKPDFRDSNNNMAEIWDNAIDFLDGLGPRIRYLRFGSSIKMIDDPFLERVKFWGQLGIPT